MELTCMALGRTKAKAIELTLANCQKHSQEMRDEPLTSTHLALPPTDITNLSQSAYYPCCSATLFRFCNSPPVLLVINRSVMDLCLHGATSLIGAESNSLN